MAVTQAPEPDPRQQPTAVLGNPRRPKRGTYKPQPETLSLLKVSGNAINGLGEASPRQASPFFWHPPDQHPYEELQIVARNNSRKCPGSAEVFKAAYTHPQLIPVAESRNPAPASQLAAVATAFALAHEAGAVGIAPMDPLYIFSGYTIEEPWVIVLALAPDYDKLKEVPSDETNGLGVTAIGEQYACGTRVSYALANWIRAQGYNASAYPGPSASALLLIPPAIASGLGELGKHGSLISRHFGAGVRLAGVTTDMPLVATRPDVFGADEFCGSCQICTRACPPGAIAEDKQMVRGVSDGTSILINASPTSRRRPPAASALPSARGRARTHGPNYSRRWVAGLALPPRQLRKLDVRGRKGFSTLTCLAYPAADSQ